MARAGKGRKAAAPTSSPAKSESSVPAEFNDFGVALSGQSDEFQDASDGSDDEEEQEVQQAALQGRQLRSRVGKQEQQRQTVAQPQPGSSSGSEEEEEEDEEMVSASSGGAGEEEGEVEQLRGRRAVGVGVQQAEEEAEEGEEGEGGELPQQQPKSKQQTARRRVKGAKQKAVGQQPAASKRKRRAEEEAGRPAAQEEEEEEERPAKSAMHSKPAPKHKQQQKGSRETQGKEKGSKQQGGKQSKSKRQCAAETAAVEEEADASEEEAEEQPASPAAARGQQPEQRRTRRQAASPTPVAAAPPLEMSLPPASAGKGTRGGTAPASGPGQGPTGRRQQQVQQPAAGQGKRQKGAAGEGGGAAAQPAGPDPAADAHEWLTRRLFQPRSSEAGTMRLRPRLQNAYQCLLDSLTNTVDLGHNNSLLVMGPRGCGKTLAVERALAALEARYNTDARDPVVGVVRLTGLAHADERTAFREAARQLCDIWKHKFSRAASLQENLEFLRNMLTALKSSDKAAVFVLDEFDLFATRRSKQTLLYNLLDALQTSGMQAAVVGLTCRHDVVEMLEKRVKSRFSHRKLDLTLPTGVLPVAPTKADDALGGGERAGQDGALEVLQAMLTLPADFPHASWASSWNASVAAATSSAPAKAALQRLVNVSPSLRVLANVADSALGASLSRGASGARRQLREGDVLGALQGQLGHAKAMAGVISGLPVLDLILLVAVHRVTAKRGDDLNFEMAYDEFQRYTVRADHVDTYSKGAAAKAWDRLLADGLVAFVDSRSEARAGSRPYAAAYLLVTREEVEEGLAGHWNCPQALQEWFKREAGLGTTAGQFL